VRDEGSLALAVRVVLQVGQLACFQGVVGKRVLLHTPAFQVFDELGHIFDGLDHFGEVPSLRLASFMVQTFIPVTLPLAFPSLRL